MANALSFLADPEYWQSVRKTAPNSLGALAQGLTSGIAGAPVDIANMALQPFGFGSERPIGGSNHLGALMRADTQSAPYQIGTMLPVSPADMAQGIPMLGVGMMRGIGGRMPETAEEVSKLSSMLERHAKNAGTPVDVGYSNISPSTYLRFKGQNEAPLEVRISNHPDRHPAMAEVEGVERISVHPMGYGYEEAIDWLKEKGVKLSKRSPVQKTEQYTVSGMEGVKASELLALRKSRNPYAIVDAEDFKLMPGLIDDIGVIKP